MTLRVTRRLGGYTQWVHLRAPTGKKLHQVQSTFVYPDKEETLRMTHRVTRRLGGYCRGNYPRVYQSHRFDARRVRASADCAPSRPFADCSPPIARQLGRLTTASCRLPAVGHPHTRPTVCILGYPEVNRSIK